MLDEWHTSIQRLAQLLADPTRETIPPDLMTEAFVAYKNRPGRDRKLQLAKLLRASGRPELAESQVNLHRAALGPGGPRVSQQIEAVRELRLDYKRVAWAVSAGHFILTDDAFSETERVAYLRWVMGVFGGWLRLNGMKLPQIPAAVLACTDLRRLSFSRNPIYELPDGLFALTALEELELQHCRFKEIPHAIGNLSALRILRLEGTPVRTLPAAIASCTELRSLELVDTRLTHLPEELGALRNLERLLLVGTRIEAVPEAILSLPRLAVLNANGTPLAKRADAMARIRERLRERAH